MNDAEEQKLSLPAFANEEQLIALLHDPSPQVIRQLLANKNIREDDVLIIAQRRNLPADIFERIAKDKRWADSYPIRFALAGNPKTPLSVSLSIVRYLRLFDIEKLTHSPHLPVAFRYKVEAIIIERIPTMPLGNKKSLAKTASGNVLLKLLQGPDQEVTSLCLDNPRMMENLLFKVISNENTVVDTIRLIVEHRNWSLRRMIRYALIRNAHTPLANSAMFLRGMQLRELQELNEDPSLPAAVRPVIYREFLDRGQEPRPAAKERMFEIDEDDDRDLELFGENDDDREMPKQTG